MKGFRPILNIGLIVVAMACVVFSAVLLKQKVDLLQQLNEKQFRIEVVEEENQRLTSDNDSLKRDLEANKEVQQNFTQIKSDLEAKVTAAEERAAAMEADLKDAQWKLEQLKNENASLVKENDSLKAASKAAASASAPSAEKDSTPASGTETPKKKFLLF